MRLESNLDLPLPSRATPHAAGYDIRSARRIERMVLDRIQVGTIAEALERARERLEAEAENLPVDVPSGELTATRGPSRADRRQQVLEGGARGLDLRQTAAALGLGYETIRVLRWATRKGYGVDTFEEAVAKFLEEG